MTFVSVRRLRRLIIASTLILTGLIVLYIVLHVNSSQIIFSDQGLEQAVRNTLQVENLHPNSLSRISHLDASYAGIRDLDGIELLSNLRSINLSGNPVMEMDSLSRLPRLEELKLQNMQPARGDEIVLGNLADLDRLLRLDLENNPDLVTLDSLGEISSLQRLSLRRTGVNNLDWLPELQQLRFLDLRETELADSDLSPLQQLPAIEHLNLRESGITSIEAVAGITSLRYLNLHSNYGIRSLEPLKSLTRLRTLILRNVPIEDQLQVIAEMRGLLRLNIRNTGISDLSLLAKLMNTGALQDDPNRGITAEVDIRDNPVRSSDRAGRLGYDVLRPYWYNITHRQPRQLPRAPNHRVLINEVMTSNGTTISANEQDSDNDNGYHDWIELHNPHDKPIDLEGFFLSNDPKNPHRWHFPDNITLPADEYLLLWASGDPGAGSSTQIHLPFTLSAGGTELILTGPDRTTLIDRMSIPAIPRDTSRGRTADGAAITFITPTPGRPNHLGREYVPVQFSHPGGFYDTDAMRLELELPEDRQPDTDIPIYYTLDGSLPDPENPVRSYRVRDHDTGEYTTRTTRTYHYTEPIYIDSRTPGTQSIANIKTTVPEAGHWYWKPPQNEVHSDTVVRATTYDTDYRSRVYSHTYFIGTDMPERIKLGVVSLATDPANLFAYENGIYVPGRTYEEAENPPSIWMIHPGNYHTSREIHTSVEFFEPDGYRAFGIDGGIRIHGGWSRSHPLKSLRVYARKDYGRENYFPYPLFPEAVRYNSHAHLSEHKRFMLRSGQSLFFSHMLDGFFHEHARPHVEVDLLRYRPVIHYINGEYWGIKNLRERFDRFYLEASYGIDPDEVIVLEGPLGFSGQLKEGRPGDHESFRSLINYIRRNPMQQERHYEYVRQQMNVDSYIDYNIMRIFSGDLDGVDKHVIMWRKRGEVDVQQPPGLDGRWRWHTWDFDNALRFPNNDTMTFYGNDHIPAHYLQQDSPIGLSGQPFLRILAQRNTKEMRYTAMFPNLLHNTDFRHRFVNRFADLLNTIYHPEVHSQALTAAAELIEPEMPRHIARWGYPESMDYWRSQVEENLAFIRTRPAIQRLHILNYFEQRNMEPGDTAIIELDLPDEGGTVQINSLVLNDATPGVEPGTPWQGIYFTGIPIAISAHPEIGYRFAGWNSSDDAADLSDEPESQFVLTDSLSLQPRFVKK